LPSFCQTTTYRWGRVRCLDGRQEFPFFALTSTMPANLVFPSLCPHDRGKIACVQARKTGKIHSAPAFLQNASKN
jgi:hypothetical protein